MTQSPSFAGLLTSQEEEAIPAEKAPHEPWGKVIPMQTQAVNHL